jgi:hypothetical protein
VTFDAHPINPPHHVRLSYRTKPVGSDDWSDDHFDVLAEGVVVGRMFKSLGGPAGMPWLWALAFKHHKDRSPTHGYEATREAAMAAFAKSWRRE